MSTKNPKVNVIFEPSVMNIMVVLAKQEHKSVASLAKELVLEALEYHEDKER